MNSEMIIFLEDLKALLLEIENPELYNETMQQFEDGHLKDMVSTIDKHIEELVEWDDEELFQLFSQIVGDA